MNEKRFVAEQVDVTSEDETEVWDIVFDTENTYAFMVRDMDTANELCDLLNEQQDKITELEKNFEDLVNWSTEISKRNVLLNEKIARLQEEEKLYAQEILRLNELLKQYQSNLDLGGDY